MVRPTENEVSDLEEFFKKNPEELIKKTGYEKELETWNKKIEDLKIKGIVTDEKKASQGMQNRTQ
jgi:hypothetical protein